MEQALRISTAFIRPRLRRYSAPADGEPPRPPSTQVKSHDVIAEIEYDLEQIRQCISAARQAAMECKASDNRRMLTHWRAMLRSFYQARRNLEAIRDGWQRPRPR